MADYDIVEAFERIEKELMESMIRNLDHHRAMETDEGFEWSQWQVEQLKALENYKKKNRKKYGTQFKDINQQLGALIYLARNQGNMEQEIKILEAIKNGFTDYHRPTKKTAAADAAFFRVNDRKIDALIEATTNDFKKAEHAMLRRANDQYRKIIYNAQVYANAGGTTYEKAVDMAIEDFLKAGINCIEYANGSRHTMKDYADMCIRTATKRAYLTGEGEKRKEWGISLVIMNKRGNPCPKCLPFVGKIMVDDVWSGGKPDGKHLLMSKAIEQGLYHPRCKDSHTTYFEGISTMKGAQYTEEEKKQIIADYNQEQKANQAKRQAEQQQRMADMMLDKQDKEIHGKRSEQLNKQFNNLKSDFSKNETITKNKDNKYNLSLNKNENDDKIELRNNIEKVNKEIEVLKKQFSDITEGYSYDEWFKDFESIEAGYGEVSEGDESFEKLKTLDKKIKDTTKKKTELLLQKEKRKQLDTGYGGKVPDDELDAFNAKALEQIKLDTGYSDEKATEFHNALLKYFGGDYESILSGETESAKIIRNGIDIMPTYDGHIYRGMTFTNEDVKMFSKLKKGDTLPQKSIIASWSSNERVAVSFGGANSYERSTVILECADNKTGVGVQHISKFGNREEEVLSSANYEVVDVIIENKYDYLKKNKNLLYFDNDLKDYESDMRGNIVCRIKVKEKS